MQSPSQEVHCCFLRRPWAKPLLLPGLSLLKQPVGHWAGPPAPSRYGGYGAWADARALQSQPLFELRCSNNVMHLHSCADSCALLVNLLQYVMSGGDLHPPPRPPSPTEIAGQKVQVRPGGTSSQSSAGPSPAVAARDLVTGEPWGPPLPPDTHPPLLPCPAQLSESPASLPSCPPVEAALINQRDLADALLDTERSLRELAQASGGVGCRGAGGQSGTPTGHPPNQPLFLPAQVAPSFRLHQCQSTCSQVNGVGPSPPRPLLGPPPAA